MSPDVIPSIMKSLDNLDDNLKKNIEKLIKDYNKKNSKIEKIIIKSEAQQLELVHLNKKIENAYQKLQVASGIDKLTSLFTRLKCEETIDKYQDIGLNFNLMLIDIDNFKQVNEKYNVTIGNHVLVEFSNLLKRVVNKSSTIGRWSGDTFLVIDPDLTLDETIDNAQEICEKIEDTFFNDVGELTASIGVISSQSSTNLSGIVTSFELALKKAKDAGKNQISI